MEIRQESRAWEQIIRNSPDIIGTIGKDGLFINVNEACSSILGYSPYEVTGSHFSNFVAPDDLEATTGTIRETLAGTKVKNFKNQCLHKDGSEVSLLWSAVWSGEDQAILIVGRDITEQEQRKHKEERHQTLIKLGSDMLAMFDQDLNYIYAEGSTLRELGYQLNEFVGKNALSYIHPEDIPGVKAKVAESLLTGSTINIPEFRFRNSEGEWRWLETRGSNQLQNPSVKAVVASSRDITERVESRLKLQESEQRFKSLFEHHLDIVLYQNAEGIIIDVNAATLHFFGLQKHEIINRSFSDFLPREIVPLCDKMLKDALNGGSVREEVTIPFEGKGVFTFDATKVPVMVNGETIGVYTTLRDITEISQSNKIIRRQAEKLSTIFESITDAFFTLDKDWTFTYINKEFDKVLLTDRAQLTGRNIWEAFPEEVSGEFYKQYSFALETGKSVHFDAFYEKLDIWLQVKAFPSEEGLSVYFNEVTEKIRAKQKLEMLSLVASKTTNGVVILDSELRAEWVNEGFERLTGFTLADVEGKNPGDILHGAGKEGHLGREIIEKLKKGEPFFKEVMNIKKSGEKIWIFLNITPVQNAVGDVVKFVAVQTDITKRKEVEESQLQLTKDLFNQNRDLQQFTYIVSHNLRSPVANALGLIEILAAVDSAADPDLYEESLTYLKRSVVKLDTVLKDLNMILSIRDKKDVLEKELVNLPEQCRQVIEDMKEPLQKCGGEVRVEMEENIQVKGDRAYLHSIFFNLMSNAIKYRSPKRPLKIKISASVSGDGRVRILFSDNGSGFDLERAGEDVFRLYRRFHSGSEGRGIGLFLVKTHIETMGGSIGVESKINAGTRFLIYLQEGK